MQINRLIQLQFFYLVLAVLWNVVALVYDRLAEIVIIWEFYLGNLIGLGVIAGIISLGRLKYIKTFQILMGFCAVGIAYSGIILWFYRLIEMQSSFELIAIVSGVVVNSFGVVLCALAAVGKFEQD